MKKVVFTFGRMNPPTTGHQLLVNKLVAYARQIGAAPRVYLSHSVGAKDPLQYDKKVSFARAAFGSLVKKSNARTVIEVLKALDKEGYTHVTMFAGSDRVPEFTKLLTKYNGNLYNFEHIEVKSAGERDPDADDVSGMSASKMRALAKDDKVAEFLRGAPNTLKAAQAKNMFNAVRRALLGEDVMDYNLDDKFISFVVEAAEDDNIVIPSDSEIAKHIDSMDTDEFDLDDADALMLDVILGQDVDEKEEMNEEVKEGVSSRWKAAFSMSQDWQHTKGSGGGLTYKIGDEDPSTQQNIMVQLMKIIDRHGSIPMAFKDGSKMNISSPKAQRILGKLRNLKPAEREKATKDKAGFVNFVKSIHESVDIEIDEARILSIQTRQKLAQRMKGMSKRLARLRDIKRKQMPATQRLRMRARKAALMILRRRATGKKSLDYNALSRSQRVAVDNALVNRFGKGLNKAVDVISKRILPMIRKKAQINVSKARDIKEQTIDPKKKTQVPDQAKDSPLNLDALKINVLDTDPQKNDRVAPNPKTAHLHKNRLATHFKSVDEGRKATGGEHVRDAGDTNIIYQMRKIINSRGEHETTFADGHKANISIADAKKMIAKFDALRMPADKHEFTVQAGKSLASFKNVMAHGIKHEKKKISLGGKSFKEFYLGVGRSRTVSAYDNDEPPGTRRIAEVAKDEDRPEDPNRSRPLSQKMDLLMRLGLVDFGDLQKYRRALRSSKKFALQSPELRTKLADLLDKLIDLTTKDPATYSRVRYNVVQKEAVALLNKAEKSGVDVDIIFEVFARGYEKNEDINEAFSRVNSFIAGGKAAEMDNDLLEDSKGYKSPSGGLTQKGRNYFNRTTGSNLKAPVTTPPSKLKKGGKAAGRRASFCARMGGMKKRLTSAKTARDPNSRINKALRKWNCRSEDVAVQEKVNLPHKYRAGLSDKTAAARKAHWEKMGKLSDRDPRAYQPAPGDATAKTKTSKHTLKYRRMYGEEILIDEAAETGLAAKAKKSGMSIDTLRKVYRRGVAAWNSGHRPGTTPQQWGMARVNSYITKGKGTYHGADKDLRGEEVEQECWTGYRQVGMKKKGDRMVPNCVPAEAASPAQQAAIAISMKKAGKTPKNESVYPERHAAAKKILGKVAKDKGGKVGFQSTSYKDGKRVTTHGHYNEKGERVVTHTTTEEKTNEVLDTTVSRMNYLQKAGKQMYGKGSADAKSQTFKKRLAGAKMFNRMTDRKPKVPYDVKKEETDINEKFSDDFLKRGRQALKLKRAKEKAAKQPQMSKDDLRKMAADAMKNTAKKQYEGWVSIGGAKPRTFVTDKSKYAKKKGVELRDKDPKPSPADKKARFNENDVPLSNNPVRGTDSGKSTKKVFEQNMTTHDAIPLAKRAKRVKSFHAWHPKPVAEVQRHADVKMVKTKLPDGRIVYRRERAAADVQHEMYTGSEPVSGNRADPANRFVGTDSIRQNYASVTPGQGSVAGEISVAKFAPEKVDYSSSMVKKTRTEVDQSKEDLGQKNLASIRKALGGIREGVELNESFAAGFELAPLARDYGIQVQSSFQHHPEVQEALDAQEDAMNEAIYQGRDVPLNKPMKGDVKKSKVYVRDPSTGNVKKVNFGDKKLSIKKDQPGRKRSYCARSSGQGNLTKKTSANYWSRRAWDC